MKNKRGSVIQIIFLILLTAAIAALIASIITIYDYRDMLQNPIGYSMQKFGLEYCSCQNTEGSFVSINAPGNNKTEINISDYVHCGQVSFNYTKYENINISYPSKS